MKTFKAIGTLPSGREFEYKDEAVNKKAFRKYIKMIYPQMKINKITMQIQLEDSIANVKFLDYHKKNPQIYEAFEIATKEAIRRGFKNIGAKFIFEIIRWESKVTATDAAYKVNNIYTPYYARLFEYKNPQYKGLFRKRKSVSDLAVNAKMLSV